MNKTEFVGKLQMVYVGDKNASADIIAEYDKLNKSLDVATEMINNKQKEIVRLNNIINELEKCIKDKYYEAIDYQTKIRQSDLMQGDYPASYYLSEQNEQLCNYFLSRLKDLQELKGSDK